MNPHIPSRANLTVVGIGASAGGLAALRTFFHEVPSDSGFAFVVVVHLSPDYKSHLADLLQPYVPIRVEQVTEDVWLEANRVYVIPPNANLSAVDTHLRLEKLGNNARESAPIDHFFRTLAATYDGRSVGVILTGTGSDGTLGLRDIKAKGGLVIVQDPDEAEFDGMPQSAIASDLPDRVLPVARIVPAILKIEHAQSELTLPGGGEFHKQEGLFLQKVLVQLCARTDRDFRRYKNTTLLRRIYSRMQLHHIEDQELYLDRLRENAGEAPALVDDILVTSSGFFRDPEVFAYLSREIVPQLFDQRKADHPVRVWSVGCATGEEAYSLALLLFEEAKRLDQPPRIQVFASDLHRRSLERARDGFYVGDIERAVSPERLKRFFHEEHGGYRIRQEIRDLVLFAPHNLLSDPPFSRLDLIACRALIGDLEPQTQRDVVEVFHHSLVPEGLLLLGPAQTPVSAGLFRPNGKMPCFYRKRETKGLELRLPVFSQVGDKTTGDNGHAWDHAAGAVVPRVIHHQMLERFAPPSILVKHDNEVVHLTEAAGRYLMHPGGEPTANVVRLVRAELRSELQATLQRVRDSGQCWNSQPVVLYFHGNARSVVLQVRPGMDPEHGRFVLVNFDERELPAARSIQGTVAVDNETRVQELEAALHNANQRLRIAVEEYESNQEEMKTSSEQMQSANAELRSTLEQLEASKEELHSTNEELLHALNDENRHKVEELAQITSDLQNLLTGVATLFLDRGLRILRFTPKLSDLFNIRPADRGRPITDLTRRLRYTELITDAQTVLSRLIPVEREVKDEKDRWYLTRVLPYRNSDDRVVGVVFTFIDVTTRKKAETALLDSEQRLRTILEGIPQLVWRSREGGDWTWASPQWRAFTGMSQAQSHGMGWLDAVHPADRAKSIEAWRIARERGTLDVDHRVRREVDDSYLLHHTRALPVRVGDGSSVEWLGTSTDIEALHQAQNAVKKSEDSLRLFVDHVHEYAMIQSDADGNIVSWNPGAERLFEYAPADVVGKPFSMFTAGDDADGQLEAAGNSRWLVRKNGTRFWATFVSEPVYGESGSLHGIANVVRDDTERKQTEDRLLTLVGELNHRVKNTLATVESIASQTLLQSLQPAEFMSHFRGRVHALARAHTLLNRTSWDGAVLSDIIQEQLAVLEAAERVVCTGPYVSLGAQSSLALALLLHELGTNARKYGALSAPAGRICIDWRIDDAILKIDWVERGGPGVGSPQRRGFGLKLIERGLLGVDGQARFQFDPAGWMCGIVIPLSALTAASGATNDEFTSH